MCSKFCNGNASELVGYTPPTLHKGVRWFVDFSAIDPARGLMRRKRYYINDKLSISAKKRRANEIMEVLTKQLSQGWNPWVRADESRGFGENRTTCKGRASNCHKWQYRKENNRATSSHIM